MCSDRSILSLKSCVFTSIVPGCQGGEWCLFRRAQVGLCVCVFWVCARYVQALAFGCVLVCKVREL